MHKLTSSLRNLSPGPAARLRTFLGLVVDNSPVLLVKRVVHLIMHLEIAVSISHRNLPSARSTLDLRNGAFIGRVLSWPKDGDVGALDERSEGGKKVSKQKTDT
jgi:hypothetical protein